MCTVLLLFRPDHEWPLLIAGNRDEMADRPASPPARHWSDRPEVTAGLDQLGGGTWMGINDYGVIAIILNRMGSLGPQIGKRSRGELPLEALDHADAEAAVEALSQLDGTAYRPFNMIIADNTKAFWIKADGRARIKSFPIPPGYHMLTAHDLDDPESSRIINNMSAFESADIPDPAQGDWSAWTEILAHGKGMCFHLPNGFGTVSSSIMALPAVASELKPVWLYTHTPPNKGQFTPVL